MKTVIIKHGKACYELIKYDETKHATNEIVEKWQKSQPCYLVRGILPACSYKLATDNNMVNSLTQCNF